MEYHLLEIISYKLFLLLYFSWKFEFKLFIFSNVNIHTLLNYLLHIQA